MATPDILVGWVKKRELVSVNRATPDWSVTERYDMAWQMWINHPGLLTVTGIGGDNNYGPISEAGAAAFIGATALKLEADS